MWRRCVCCPNLNVEHHIEVELNLDEMDLMAAESKAIYAEIKEYVLEKYRLKVPQMPLEKEKAIEDSLRYFQMI